MAFAEAVGADGCRLLEAVYAPPAPAWLREVPAVECLRRVRYRGFPKAHLQHVLTAISMNLVRLVAWSADPAHRPTQASRFVPLASAA